MKVRAISKSWLVMALMAVLAVALSGAALAAELSDDEIYRLAEGEVVDDDLYIGATEIYIDGTVKGDLIAGAQYIEIGPTGTIEGDLWAAGTSIVVKGTVLDDMRAAAAGVELSGLVGDDAFLSGAGGQFVFLSRRARLPSRSACALAERSAVMPSLLPGAPTSPA